MPNPTDVPGPPPDKVVEQYLKLKALADHPTTDPHEARIARKRIAKLRGRHPGITGHVEQRVADVKRAAAEERFAQATGVPIQAPGPDASWVERALHNVANWGFSKVVDGLDADDIEDLTEELFAKRGGRKRKVKRVQPTRSLLERMYEEIGVGEVAFDEDDHGQVLRIELDVPMDLWADVCKAKTGPDRFVEWLNDIAEDDDVGQALDPDLEA